MGFRHVTALRTDDRSRAARNGDRPSVGSSRPSRRFRADDTTLFVLIGPRAGMDRAEHFSCGVSYTENQDEMR